MDGSIKICAGETDCVGPVRPEYSNVWIDNGEEYVYLDKYNTDFFTLGGCEDLCYNEWETYNNIKFYYGTKKCSCGADTNNICVLNTKTGVTERGKKYKVLFYTSKENRSMVSVGEFTANSNETRAQSYREEVVTIRVQRDGDTPSPGVYIRLDITKGFFSGKPGLCSG